MASIRQGYLDDYSQQNQNVGIGTSIPKEKLEIHGGVTSKDLSVTGIATITSVSGFIGKKLEYAENVDLDAGDSATLSDVIVVGAGLTMTIGTGVTAGQGNIDSLKVYKMFQPPSGTTNQRPVGKPGSLFYNFDFKTVEFFDGNSWRQVDNTTTRGRAIFSANLTNMNLDFVNISSLGNSRSFGTLSDSRASAFGCASETRGLWGAGQTPSRQDTIDYVTIASEGNAIDFGNLIAPNSEPCATSSSTRGIWCGGYKNPGGASNRTNVIQYVEIATLGNALDFGDITVIQVSQAAASSPTRAIFSGGYQSPHQYEVVTIASKGNAVRFGDMASIRARHDGCSNGTRAVFGGGRSGGAFTIVGKLETITISTEGNGIEFGTLTSSRSGSNMLASASNKTRGLFAGGYDPATSPTNSNVIDFITFSSLGDALDFGDLIEEKRGVSGLSDSHGGLGGF